MIAVFMRSAEHSGSVTVTNDTGEWKVSPGHCQTNLTGRAKGAGLRRSGGIVRVNWLEPPGEVS
jgi:hypothetical protein